MNLKQTADALDAYMTANIPVFLWGAPGVGKSDSVRQIARRRMPWADTVFAALGLPYNLPVIDLRAILLDPVDLRGLPMVESGKAAWAQPAFLPQVERDGPAGILFLDELNAAPASVQAACFQLILDRRLGEYELPTGWRIVAAGNRQSDRAAAQRMPSPLANRFAHVDVEPDVQSWGAWAISENLSPVVLAFLRFRPDLLHKMDGSDLRAFPTPRAWANVAKVAGAPDDIRQALVAGIVGEGAAAEFEGFVRVWRSIPSLADIVANPDGVNVPDDPATLYAVATGLARKADRNNFAPILRFSKRALGPEFSILLCVDAVSRDGGLKETRAFIEWADANQDVTL